MSGAPGPVGTLEVALAHADRLLATAPQLAAEQATEILAAVPGHPVATLVLGIARRLSDDAPGALAVLEPLAESQPAWAPVQYELGLALAAVGRGEDAVPALRRAVALKPDMPDAWRTLADHLSAMGDVAGADVAYAQHVRYSSRDPRLLEAGAALCENQVPRAETLLREHLKQHPTDVAAIRMLAEVALRLGRNSDAEKLLTRCLELAPGFSSARHNLAIALHRQARPAQAREQIELALANDPKNPGYRNLKAAILGRLGEFEEAIDTYAGVLAEYPGQPKAWMSYGHALKAAGRQEDSVNAYRKSIELSPGFGEAWWSLANLKTFRFSPADIAAMQEQLGRSDISNDDRLHFHFSLGKALEDSGEFEDSFGHYDEGNRLRRATAGYDANENTAQLRRSSTLFTSSCFAARGGRGHPAGDPIFIVGLPRAGSTLLEQILSSHSAVEGTMELPDMISIAQELGGRGLRASASRYPEVLAELSPDELRELGQRYLNATRVQRKTDAPFFIDKMPNNFAHAGLIHLILPNARIIDARRHPLACCFSNFKQHFARGQHFTYDLADIGRYYADYVALMAHFDAVLPGRVHRVLYEDLVEDTERVVRRLLDYCGLPFEESCLRFHENERAVRTASSEQVRQPIYRDGVDHWRHYEPWLDPLKEALGPVLDAYPVPPDDVGWPPAQTRSPGGPDHATIP
jgi:tetratricopeptide (TPR) repeat protein